MEGCLTAIHLQVVISWHELQHNRLMQRMIAVTAKLQILYPFIFYSYLTNYCSNMHKIWWACRSMGLLTTHQNQLNRTPLTIQTIHLPKLLCSEMAANRIDKTALKSDVSLNQSSNKLKTSTCPK